MQDCEQNVVGQFLDMDKLKKHIYSENFAFSSRLDAQKFVVNKILDIITLEK